MGFHIVRNDITKMNVDAIVNSANPKPTYAFGTDKAIYIAAGAERMLVERKKIGALAPGTAAQTSAGKLNAKYVIHTVAPLWEDGDHSELEILKACYSNALNLAKALQCKSIAFPLLATGVYGFPKDKALEIAMISIQTFLMRFHMDVYLVVFDEKSFVLSGQIFDQIQSYVDANYVADAAAIEYSNPSENGSIQSLSEDDRLRMTTLDELAVHGRKQLQSLESEDVSSCQKAVTTISQTYEISNELTFQEQLFRYIDRSGMKPSAIYRPIEMSRQQYSRMQCNRNYQPKKNTAILLSIILKLSVAETEDLLSRAGYAFNPSSKQDVIVKACLVNGQYDLFVIDAMMQKNNLDTLVDYEGKQA